MPNKIKTYHNFKVTLRNWNLDRKLILSVFRISKIYANLKPIAGNYKNLLMNDIPLTSRGKCKNIFIIKNNSSLYPKCNVES